MADPASQVTTPARTPKYHTPKDKACPYCGQVFTSSSLGRHLDLYIKEKNPKAPDGLHDVDAIRKLRGKITRRHPRNSTATSRDASTPVGTPKPQPRKDSVAESELPESPATLPTDGQHVTESTLSRFPFTPTWEATGVINDIPASAGEGSFSQAGESSSQGGKNKRPNAARAVSKQVLQKAQLDVKQQLADARDTGRAAELALRELLSSWRAAKAQIDSNSMPFDFDPRSLDFPALTLQCLQPPPTLFSSIQHATSTSWSVKSPGQREFEALKAYFREEFRKWKVACAAATTAAFEELTYPPRNELLRNQREAVKKAEKSADNLEKQLDEHLMSSYKVWHGLNPQRRNDLWVLELARSVGRKQKETDKLRDHLHQLQQENANMKSQIEHLNRLQQPREFKLLSPTTFPLSQQLINSVLEAGVKGQTGVGLSMEDRHLDLNTIVASSIERWKKVIVSSRNASGMAAQRPLDQAAASPSTNGPPVAATAAQRRTQHHQQQQQQPQLPQPQLQPPVSRQATTSSNAASSDTAPSTTTGPPSVAETSDPDGDIEVDDVDADADADHDADADADDDADADADADAEMEDDEPFAVAVAPPPPPAKLEVPRTRGTPKRLASASAAGGPGHGPAQQPHPHPHPHPHHHLALPNGTAAAGRAAATLARSVPGMQAALQAGMDMGLLQAVRGGGEPMFMD